MARTYDATTMASAWSTGFTGSTEKYKRNVNSVETAPGATAVAHADTWLAQVQASFEKWKRNTGAVPLQSWKDSCTTTGVNNFSSGATKGKPKQQRFWAAAGPIFQQIVTQVRAMPNANKAQRRARMNANLDLIEQMLTGAGRS